MDAAKKKLSHIITIRLLLAVFAAFVVSSAVIYAILCIRCSQKAEKLLQYACTDVGFAIDDDHHFIINEQITSVFVEEYLQYGEEALKEILSGTGYTYVTDPEGTIMVTGKEEFLGRSIRDIEYMPQMLKYVREASDSIGENIRVYESTPVPVKTLDGKKSLYYVLSYDSNMPGKLILCGISPEDYAENNQYATATVADRNTSGKVGTTGFCIITDGDYRILSHPEPYPALYNTIFPYSGLLEKYDRGSDGRIVTVRRDKKFADGWLKTEKTVMLGRDSLWDRDCFYGIYKQDDAYIICVYPAEEAMEQANDTIFFIVLIEVLVFAVLFLILNMLIRRRVVRKLDSVNASLDRITAGDLEEKIEVRDTYEFDVLSNDINATVDRLKEYIAETAARIDADLAVAKAIQTSVLPNVFPPFPEKKEFELFASMSAAKEVGGDFYDFYVLGDDTLGFIIADVSGKSIPGAMFMMTAKSVIKGFAESGLSVNEVFTNTNEKLCEGNDAEMFLTAWMGYLDLDSGVVHVANAGHNPPVLIRDGKAEFVILKPGLMLAGMDGMLYKEQSLELQKGDILFLYTDGVTEAMDPEENQYGEDRLLTLLSFGEDYPQANDENGIAGAVCEMVSADIKDFVRGAEQSDDITMLCVRYLGGGNGK